MKNEVNEHTYLTKLYEIIISKSTFYVTYLIEANKKLHIKHILYV